MPTSSADFRKNIFSRTAWCSLLPIVMFAIPFFNKSFLSFSEAGSVVSAYSVFLGIYYFFKRLEFDRKSLLLKGKKERLAGLLLDVLKIEEHFRKLIAFKFTNASELDLHRIEMQGVQSKVLTILEILSDNGDLVRSDSVEIIKFISLIENDMYFNDSFSNLSGNTHVQKNSCLKPFEIALGKVKTNIYKLNFEIDFDQIDV